VYVNVCRFGIVNQNHFQNVKTFWFLSITLELVLDSGIMRISFGCGRRACDSEYNNDVLILFVILILILIVIILIVLIVIVIYWHYQYLLLLLLSLTVTVITVVKMLPTWMN